MNFIIAKKGISMLISSGILDEDIGIFGIFTSNFTLKSRSIRDWINRVYLSFLINQVRDFFIDNPKLFLIYFKEEYPNICKDEILNITNGLINTPNLKCEQLVDLINAL